MQGTFTMEKLADTTYPIEPLLERRWSPRAFADRPVEPEKLLRLLEAARWSASCANQQPWYFIVATKEHTSEHARLLSYARSCNRTVSFTASTRTSWFVTVSMVRSCSVSRRRITAASG